MKSKITLKTIAIISCSVLLVAILAVGVMAFAGPVNMFQPEPSIAAQTEPATDLSNQGAESVTENYIDQSEAIAIALTHAGVAEADTSHLHCNLDYDDGIAEYEVEFWDGTKEYDYEINAVSGDIIGFDYDMESYEAKPSTPATANTTTENYIDQSEAIAIALAHAGVAEADTSHLHCNLDYDDGIAEYEVEFWDGTKEYDYEINAVSGDIIGFDYDMESYEAKPSTPATANTTTENYIDQSEAIAIALAHAGVAESDAGYIKCEFDFDDGYAEYEVEWEIGRIEYEYTISATDGAVWEYEVD